MGRLPPKEATGPRRHGVQPDRHYTGRSRTSNTDRRCWIYKMQESHRPNSITNMCCKGHCLAHRAGLASALHPCDVETPAHQAEPRIRKDDVPVVPHLDTPVHVLGTDHDVHPVATVQVSFVLACVGMELPPFNGLVKSQNATLHSPFLLPSGVLSRVARRGYTALPPASRHRKSSGVRHDDSAHRSGTTNANAMPVGERCTPHGSIVRAPDGWHHRTETSFSRRPDNHVSIDLLITNGQVT